MSDGAWYGHERWNNSMPDETEKVETENPWAGKGCCDHGCVIDPPKGMGTNATCRCPDWKLRAFASWLKRERNALQSEVDRMKPVVEAAIELRESGSLDSDYQPDVRLMITVDAFKKKSGD